MSTKQPRAPVRHSNAASRDLQQPTLQAALSTEGQQQALEYHTEQAFHDDLEDSPPHAKYQDKGKKRALSSSGSESDEPAEASGGDDDEEAGCEGDYLPVDDGRPAHWDGGQESHLYYDVNHAEFAAAMKRAMQSDDLVAVEQCAHDFLGFDDLGDWRREFLKGAKAGDPVFCFWAQCPQANPPRAGREGPTLTVILVFSQLLRQMHDNLHTPLTDILHVHDFDDTAGCKRPSAHDIKVRSVSVFARRWVLKKLQLVNVGDLLIGKAASTAFGVEYCSVGTVFNEASGKDEPYLSLLHFGNLGYNLPADQSGPLTLFIVSAFIGILLALSLPPGPALLVPHQRQRQEPQHDRQAQQERRR